MANLQASPNFGPKCDFEVVREAVRDPRIIVIDVREPNELIEAGKIEGTVNVPLGEVQVALGPEVSKEEFRKRYSAHKPDKEFPIIFTCRSGRRSGIAQKTAFDLGYTRVSNYTGGWLDWEKHTQGR
ncbi:rhodanese domain-containing protein CG4456-like [Sitophilus oryzae]|uniref:Rhodanese domain-containing protein CG4456-like n=1 Tax=Sitophilus oryzae TaxID=7048 RepID=A0A6J2XBN3_SITOR|nr:rhodanese domain-containing protein CG4456-like [Sitophilus oryzae]